MTENKSFLPIGTVLKLKNGTKKIMINAYGVFSKFDKGKIYEYGACLYPEGIIDSNNICVFNHDDIEEVFHLGYITDEQSNYCKKLNENYESYIDTLKNV